MRSVETTINVNAQFGWDSLICASGVNQAGN